MLHKNLNMRLIFNEKFNTIIQINPKNWNKFYFSNKILFLNLLWPKNSVIYVPSGTSLPGNESPERTPRLYLNKPMPLASLCHVTQFYMEYYNVFRLVQFSNILQWLATIAPQSVNRWKEGVVFRLERVDLINTL